MIRIAALYVYPVKSCRGIALERSQVTATGLRHDREWMVVTPAGRFLTQRELPKLALVVPVIDADSLRLAAPGVADLVVPLGPGPAAGAVREVLVWRDQCLARDAGDAAATWLSGVLGRDVRLVRFDPSRSRPTEPDGSQGLPGASFFADGYPVLVLSQASLDDLNARLPSPLPLDRFRPNVLLDGCAPYEEDRIAALATGNVRLRLVKPCTRCAITTTNQATGEVEGDEPLRTLRAYRWNRELRGVVFAVNAVVESGVGATVEVGAEVAVTARPSRPVPEQG